MQPMKWATHRMDCSPPSMAFPLTSHCFDRRTRSGRARNILLDEVYQSLAAFQTSLISLNSRYDRYAHGYHAALSEHEIEGLNIFRSFVARCAECHTPPLFTNQQVAVIGAPEPDGRPLDIGAEKTFNAPRAEGGIQSANPAQHRQDCALHALGQI